MTIPQPRHDTYDAVIVGARCAGAATAMLLATRPASESWSSTRRRYGTDTLSTHALMRPAVLLLQRWGLTETPRSTAAPLAYQRTTFCYADDSEYVKRSQVDIKPRHGVEALYAPRRTCSTGFWSTPRVRPAPTFATVCRCWISFVPTMAGLPASGLRDESGLPVTSGLGSSSAPMGVARAWRGWRVRPPTCSDDT